MNRFNFFSTLLLNFYLAAVPFDYIFNIPSSIRRLGTHQQKLVGGYVTLPKRNYSTLPYYENKNENNLNNNHNNGGGRPRF